MVFKSTSQSFPWLLIVLNGIEIQARHDREQPVRAFNRTKWN